MGGAHQIAKAMRARVTQMIGLQRQRVKRPEQPGQQGDFVQAAQGNYRACKRVRTHKTR